MHILLKFEYGKFSFTNLWFPKVIKEKPLGLGSNPHPFGTERVKYKSCYLNAR